MNTEPMYTAYGSTGNGIWQPITLGGLPFAAQKSLLQEMVDLLSKKYPEIQYKVGICS